MCSHSARSPGVRGRACAPVRVPLSMEVEAFDELALVPETALVCVEHGQPVVCLCTQCQLPVCRMCTACNNHRKSSINQFSRAGLTKAEMACIREGMPQNVLQARATIKGCIVQTEQIIEMIKSPSGLARLGDDITHWESDLFKDEEIHRKACAYVLNTSDTSAEIDGVRNKLLAYIDEFLGAMHSEVVKKSLVNLSLQVMNATCLRQLRDNIVDDSNKWSAEDLKNEYVGKLCQYFNALRGIDTFNTYLKMLRTKLSLLKLLGSPEIDYDIERFIIMYCYTELTVGSKPSVEVKEEGRETAKEEVQDYSGLVERISFESRRRFLWFVNAAIAAPMKTKMGLMISEPVFLPISYTGFHVFHAGLSEDMDFAYSFMDGTTKELDKKDVSLADHDTVEQINKKYKVALINLVTGQHTEFYLQYKPSIGFYEDRMFLFLDGSNIILESTIRQVYEKKELAFRPHFIKSNISGYCETQLCPQFGVAIMSLQNKMLLEYNVKDNSSLVLTKCDGNVISTLGIRLPRYRCFFTTGLQDLKRRSKSKAILNALETSNENEKLGKLIYEKKHNTNLITRGRKEVLLAEFKENDRIIKISEAITHPKYLIVPGDTSKVLNNSLIISDEGLISTSPAVSMGNIIDGASRSLFFTKCRQLGLKSSIELEGTGGFAMVRVYENVFICFDMKHNGWVAVRIEY